MHAELSLLHIRRTVYHMVMSDIKGIFTSLLFMLVQLTWGFLQSFLGFLLLLLNIRRRHYIYHGAVVTEWKPRSSVSLGLFVFCSDDPYFAEPNGITREDAASRLLTHEYGHTIQSLVLGPLYLLVIGIPSVTWAFLPYFRKMRRERGIPYSRAYCEASANRLGEKHTGKISIRDMI